MPTGATLCNLRVVPKLSVLDQSPACQGVTPRDAVPAEAFGLERSA